MGNINIEIDENLHKKAKIHCATNSITIKDFMIKLLEEEVKESGKKGR
jgi:predicted HicB family RNase H-like nuclease